MKPAIQVQGISKRFRLGAHAGEGYRTLRESIVNGVRAPIDRLRRRRHAPAVDSQEFWALKDVSFDVQPGEVVGIIGRNGSGKSTLLKILSQIYEPTAGRAVVRGRLASLLEVGTGFHPELTGRENIYLNGSILGMTHKEIDRKFDEIVAFSEIEQFLDTPIKRYSSGMYIRLAFAVAANLEPEIMIVDEVLAVGDAEFQKRCLGKMGQVARSGRTVLFVSHSMSAVQNLCSRCLLVQQGRVTEDGTPLDVIQAYTRAISGTESRSHELADHAGRMPGSVPAMQRLAVVPHGGEVLFMGSDVDVRVDFASPTPLTGVDFGLVVKDYLQVPVFGINNKVTPCSQPGRSFRTGSVTCHLSRLPLMPGQYSLDLFFGSNGHDVDIILDAIRFEVLPFDVFGTGKLPPRGCGNVYWPATWTVAPAV